MTTTPTGSAVSPALRDHVATLEYALRFLHRQLPTLEHWGVRLAATLSAGGRLLAAGNGGSAAHAQHLTSELVGRFVHNRAPLSAIALTGEACAFTAIVNDFGADEAFARQVRAHGRSGDVLIALSTSGRSSNLLAAASAAHETGLDVWAMTGPAPNPLIDCADEHLALEAPTTAAVQELHQVAVHLLCTAVESALPDSWFAVPGGKRR